MNKEQINPLGGDYRKRSLLKVIWESTGGYGLIILLFSFNQVRTSLQGKDNIVYLASIILALVLFFSFHKRVWKKNPIVADVVLSIIISTLFLFGFGIYGILQGKSLLEQHSPTDNQSGLQGVNNLPPKEDWKNFTSERDGFSVLLPSQPGYKATDYPIGDGTTISEHKYVAQVGSVIYVINKYSFSDEGAMSEMASQPEGVLQYFLTQSVANQEGSKLLSSEFTYYGQYKAYDYLIDRSGIAKTQGRTILAGSAIYEILMGYPTDDYSEQDYNKFVYSLDLK